MTSEPRDDDTLWADLGEPGTPAQRRAVVAAFALMSVADGAASAAEVLSFREKVSVSKVFADFDLPALWADFDDLVARLLRHEPAALTEVNERLRGASDVDSRDVVMAAARAALVADAADADREEVVMGHIARQIGADPTTV